MNLVIFGAGASTGSQAASVPPVTANLLPELRFQFYRTWGHLNPDIVNAGKGDFELIVLALIDSGMGSQAWSLQRDLARFFVRFSPSNDSLYTRFVKDVVSSDITFCTLNYDVLLQRSLALSGKLIWTVGFEDRRDGAIPLILPHGSAALCNTTHTIEGNVAIDSDPFAMFSIADAPAKLLLNNADRERAFDKNQLNPIMSYIEPKKRSLMGSKNLEIARDALTDSCMKAERVTVVGMRFQQHDGHIVEALKATTGEVMVCCGPDGAEYSRQLGRRVTDLKQYWSDGYDTIVKFILGKSA